MGIARKDKAGRAAWVEEGFCGLGLSRQPGGESAGAN